jgi:hypothetical protein
LACQRSQKPQRAHAERQCQETAWTQRDAREWWQTRAPAMLAARRAAEATGSRGPNLAVDVASRMRSRLPELSLEEEGTKTAMRPPITKP